MSKESKESKELTEWYEGLDKEQIEPNGVIKVTVPVIDADTQEPIKIKTDGGFEGSTTLEKPEDPVISKDKDVSLRCFVLAKKIQDFLIQLAGLVDPYEADSEERQSIADKIKELSKELGEEIVKL